MEHTKGELATVATFDKLYLHVGKIRIADIPNTGAISEEEGMANADHLVKCWNAFEEGGSVDELLKALEGALEAMDKPAVQAAGEWQTGLFCGLEDRNLTDRYEACMYGYEQALEKVQEWVLCDFEAAIAEAKNDKERGSNETNKI